MIKYLAVVFGAVLFSGVNLQAKSDFELKSANIEAVSVSNSKLILIVSGDCDFLLAKQTDAGGDAKPVKSILNHGIITVFRSGEIYFEPKSWDAFCKKAREIAQKKEPVTIQCIASQLTISGGEIAFVTCKEATFGTLTAKAVRQGR